MQSQRVGILSLIAASFIVSAVATSPAGDGPKNDPRGSAPARFRVTGYLPDYRMASFHPSVATGLTDLVYFSVQPKVTGELDLRQLRPKDIVTLRKAKNEHKLTLLLSVGGWERSQSFAPMAASATTRERFVGELVHFCKENDFDGVDLDWEHPKNAAEVRDLTALLSAVKKAFAPLVYQLTMAVAGWQELSPELIAAVDRFHLMAYDAEGRHSTFEFAKADVERLFKKGIPRSKICLGVPFYGREVKKSQNEQNYVQIMKKYRPAADVDEVAGIYFNGVETIERKTRFARETGLAGVMIWEIGQDSNDKTSLLKAISRALEKPEPSR
jgi:chitinase